MRKFQGHTDFYKTFDVGILWWSGGKDLALSLPWAWVQSLVRELRSALPKNKNKKKLQCTYWHSIFHRVSILPSCCVFSYAKVLEVTQKYAN